MACMVAGLGLAGSAWAMLLDRGPDVVYDDVLDITWTRNANVPGISRPNWADANARAANLIFAGFDDWRLPYASVSAGAGPTATAVDCSTASELACRDNELGYMFYHDLRGLPGDYKTGTQTAVGGQQLTGIGAAYWSGTELDSDRAWFFEFDGSHQAGDPKEFQLWAWAVRDGDVAVVPEAATVLLIGVGMLGLACTRSRRRRSSFSHSDD
jgi:PEP-CTERM motif